MGWFSTEKDEHLDLFDKSNLQVVCSFKYEALQNDALKKIVTDINAITRLVSLSIRQKKYQGDVAEEFRKINHSLGGHRAVFQNESGTELSFFTPFHYATPPHEVLLLFSSGKDNEIEKLVNYLIQCDQFMSLYIANREYDTYQNTLELDFYLRAGLNKRVLKFRKSITGGKEINTAKNAGWRAVIADTWIGAAWKMYFGPDFYRYVPKSALQGFKGAFTINELPNDRLFIQLYEHHNESHFLKNRRIQYDFQKCIKMHELIKKDLANARK